MELLLKAIAASLTALITGILIKRTNPELSLILSVCTIAIVLFSAIGVLDGLRSIRQAVKQITQSSEIYVLPIMKCLGISMITKIGSDICKDSSQAAIASSLELSGAVCGLAVVTPLIINLLKTIGGLS